MSDVVKQQKVVAKRELGDGVTLGVLEDGTAFVNARGVADLCSIAHSTFITWAAGWREGKRKNALAKFLVGKGVDTAQPQLHIPTDDGQHAYPDAIVLHVLEFYATHNRAAATNLRRMAGHALREFIYKQTNYSPRALVDDQWRHFHDRLLLVDVPPRHFCVFKEMAGMVVQAINGGLRMNERTIPDGSVGIAWGKHWTENNLAARYGDRITFKHNYPDYYPQSASNPQPAKAYPRLALGEFREWLEDEYLPKIFPGYLARKVKEGVLAEGTARNVLAAVNQSPNALPLSRPKPTKALPPPKAKAPPKKRTSPR